MSPAASVRIFLILFVTLVFSGCGQSTGTTMSTEKTSLFEDNCKSLTCKLTSAELRQRKAIVISQLKKNVLEKKELDNGYSFKFTGSDQMIDTLTSFIKTERQCCDFFTFQLSVQDADTSVWLTLTGPEGTKDFIHTELEW